MLKIGDFSRLSRVSIRMLRHYDDMGLLTPKRIDKFTGYRYYAEEQLSDATRIQALKEMGFSLAAIGEILRNYGNPTALAEYLSVKRSEVYVEAEEAKRRLLLLETAIERLRKDECAMNYNVTVKTLPERYVASVRQVIPSYSEEHILWDILMKEAGKTIVPAENSLGLAVFHDEDYKENDVDVEIQISVKPGAADTEHVKFKTMPAIEIASAVYKGSYEQLTEVNRTVASWISDNGYVFNGAMFCIYHVSPAQTQNPDEYVTEVCFPVRKKG